MQFRCGESRFVLRPLVLASMLGTAVNAQSCKAPRNEFGQPDFQGNWTNATLTQFERRSLGGRDARRRNDEFPSPAWLPRRARTSQGE